jgi:hypothetical protein
MTVGFVLVLVGAFIMVIAVKGTYKYLPPFYNPPPPPDKVPSISEATSKMPVG